VEFDDRCRKRLWGMVVRRVKIRRRLYPLDKANPSDGGAQCHEQRKGGVHWGAWDGGWLDVAGGRFTRIPTQYSLAYATSRRQRRAVIMAKWAGSFWGDTLPLPSFMTLIHMGIGAASGHRRGHDSTILLRLRSSSI
jgi:hypothetical protein